MSFKFGSGKSSSSTTANENFTKTSTPNVPDWLQTPIQSMVGKVQELSAYNPASLVPGVSDLQSKAAAMTADTGDYGAVNKLLNTPAPTTSAESLLKNLDAYMSPYRRDVVDSALADFDYGAGQTRAQQALDLAGSGAFGGSGAAITQSMTEDNLNRGRATTSANLLNEMFNTGASLSNQDAQRRQAANDLNAQLALQTRANKGQLALSREDSKRADLEALFGLGSGLRDIEAEQAQAPFQLADWSINALAGLNPALFTGQTDTGSSTSTGTSKGKNSSFGLGFSAGDIGKIIAGLG